MKTHLWLACGLVALSTAWLCWRTTRPQPLAAPSLTSAVSATPPAPGAEPAASPVASRARRIPAGHGEAVMDAIQTATATHDVRMIPLLARYLESDAADVRAAALQGLIELGERDAIPYLKLAAQETSIPQEKIELTKAIEFLSLPTIKEHREAVKTAPPPQR